MVLEDVDLIAEHREMHMGPQPLLFTLLDAMDGLTAEADVAFILTTNRADLLEAALSQRPGRVDLAVEIPLPDEAARRALLRPLRPRPPGDPGRPRRRRRAVRWGRPHRSSRSWPGAPF